MFQNYVIGPDSLNCEKFLNACHNLDHTMSTLSELLPHVTIIKISCLTYKLFLDITLTHTHMHTRTHAHIYAHRYILVPKLQL